MKLVIDKDEKEIDYLFVEHLQQRLIKICKAYFGNYGAI